MSRSIFDVYSSDKVTFMPRISNHKSLAKEKNRIIFQTKYPNMDDICAICLSNMLNANVKHTPCGHTFHLTCLTKWQKHQNERNVQCPNCRALLPRLRYVFPYMPNYPKSESESEPESESESAAFNLSQLRHYTDGGWVQVEDLRGGGDGGGNREALINGDYLSNEPSEEEVEDY